MIFKEDNSFHEIRERSVAQWLGHMSSHEDIEVRGGVKATLEYIESLQKRIDDLESKDQVKSRYLKQMAQKSKEA